jgi:hypothetical protein
MEQLGYMKRFSYDADKVKKYGDRLEAALKKYTSMQGGRRWKRTLRRRNKGRRRTGRKH